MVKNNITRLLETNSIAFQVFALPKEKLGAQETATILNIPITSVFKSIVVVREEPGKPMLAVVSGDHEVDLKALAHVVNEKKLRIPSESEAERITGLQAGGISPLALFNHGFQIFLDSAALNQEWIHISGGERGVNIRIKHSDLITLCRCRVELISRSSNTLKL